MENDRGFKIGCLAFALLFVLIISLIIYDEKYTQPRRRAEDVKVMQTWLENYGRKATVEGFQLIRMGTKSANFTYHDYVVVANERGERLRLQLRSQPAVRGDVWSLRLEGEEIVLDTLLERGKEQ